MTDPPPDPPIDTPGGEQAYFRTIEDAFIRLRGSPFLLSPADWRLAQGWFDEGVPVDVVRAALEDVFARRAERAESRKVQSLRYCAAAVEEAWRARRELGGGQSRIEDYRIDVASRLARLAAALPESLPGRELWAQRILAAGDDPQAAEKTLVALDGELVDAHLATLDAAARAALDAAVDASVARLGPRLAADVAAADRDRLSRENARRGAGLPLLSLFSPDAR